MSHRITRGLAPKALLMASWHRPPDGESLHCSDRGSRCASGTDQTSLGEYSITCSTSGTGTGYDDTDMESVPDFPRRLFAKY